MKPPTPPPAPLPPPIPAAPSVDTAAAARQTAAQQRRQRGRHLGAALGKGRAGGGRVHRWEYSRVPRAMERRPAAPRQRGRGLVPAHDAGRAVPGYLGVTPHRRLAHPAQPMRRERSRSAS